MQGKDNSPLVDRGGPRARRHALVAVLAVAVGLLLAWLALPPDRQEDASSGLSGMEGEEVPEPQSASQAAVQVPAPDPGTQPPAVRVTALWGVADLSTVPNPPPYPDSWSKEGRALVRLGGDLAEARALAVGDSVSLSVPQLGLSQSATVDEVEAGQGVRSLVGWVAWDGGPRRRWVVTVGQESLFAYLDTPAGPHELAVRDGGSEGWMVPMGSKLAGMNLGKDYVLPHAARQAN